MKRVYGAPATPWDHKALDTAIMESLQKAWKDIEKAECIEKPPIDKGRPSPGGSIFVPVNLNAGESKTVTVLLCWYWPVTNVQSGSTQAKTDEKQKPPTYQPWYADKFKDINEVANHWKANFVKLRLLL